MPKSANQKLKLLYLMRYLQHSSDEDHPVTIQQMIDELSKDEIKAERKSLYDDIETLRSFGLDIVQQNGNYYVASRDFELPELKLLVDSVQSSKFITQKKTLGLIKKIEQLASVYDAQKLQRQVYVRNRVKSMNESVYYNVDEISGAITQDRMICFKYFDYTVSKQRKFRKDGSWYEISPFSLIWDNENYYMLGYDAAAGLMKHYRVDKMTEISALKKRREGKEAFRKIDMPNYSKEVFDMFSGKIETVTLRFASHLVGAVIDRFGTDTVIVANDSEHFTVNVDVAISPRFYAWLFGFGTEVEVIYPEEIRSEYAETLDTLKKLYE
ncbi:MAG: WYL domain-containing protein [Eubacteriales bacterium]|nr:WYL domain-containing protein [Eubacteriales bacterium]